ncbi:MAG: alpha-amylase family glycosyl hydrolase [Ruminococcus sp.]|nr:alpha-amylase family glycosyl hydrolase [Ruminococcus sp.]
MTDFGRKTVYQVYPKSFRDSDGDGFGDIRGIIEKLDYLKELEIDYLWITPVFISPMNDNGYDVADYYKINPQFGTMEDMDELIRECDNRGIGLMLDMVFNHTSTEHEWFRRALAGEKNIRTTTYSGMNRKIRFRQTGSQNSAVLHGSMYHH